MKLAALFVMVTFSSFGATVYCGPSNTGGGTGADFSNLIQFTDGTGFSRANEYVLVDGSYGARTLSEPVSGTTVISIRKASAADSAVAGYSSTLHDGQASFGTITFTTDYWLLDGITRDSADWFDDTAYGISVRGTLFWRNLDAEVAGDNVTVRFVEAGNRAYTQTFATGDGNEAVYCGGFSALVQDLIFEDCFFHNGGFAQLAGVDGVEFTRCVFAAGYAKESIRGQNVAKNGIIRWCIFYNASQTNPDDMPPQGSTADIAIWDDGSSGLTSFDNWEIYGNVIWNDKDIAHSGGVIIVGGNGGSWAGSSASNVKIYNNTIVGIQGAFTAAIILINGGSGNEVRNTIWYDCFSTPSANPNTSNNSEESSDPFVNYAGGNFHLAAALAGTSLSSPYNADMDGVTRGSDGVFDRGAFEFDAGVPPTPNTPRVHGGIRGFRGF